MFGIDNIFARPKVWPHLDQVFFFFQIYQVGGLVTIYNINESKSN